MTIADAIEAHEYLIDAFGGRSGVLSRHLLESALGRPYHGYHRAIHRKGAALVESLVGNHPFVDGNKRTAAQLLLLLLDRSGFDLQPATPGDDVARGLEDLVVRVAGNESGFQDLADWLKLRCRKVR